MRLKYSLTTGSLLILFAFMPVPQIVILLLNSALFGWLTDKNYEAMMLLNGIFSIGMLSVFYLQTKTRFRIGAILGFLTFSLPLVVYACMDRINDLLPSWMYGWYFIPFLLFAAIATLLVGGVEYLKMR
jgi:hypothetical protein